MTHIHDSDDAELRALLRATDDATPLTPERETELFARIMGGHATLGSMLRATDDAVPLADADEAQLAARIVAQGAGWLALQAEHVATRPTQETLDELARRIKADAQPLLATYRRPVRRTTWVDVAVKWSRPALPLAIAAGIGAMMVLMRTPRPVETALVADASDVSSAYDAVGASERGTVSTMTPEAAIGGSAEVTP
jgi:hypothetical protein